MAKTDADEQANTNADAFEDDGGSSGLLSGVATIALVGNGPIWSEAALEIDNSDIVVRMNRAPLRGVAGKRTDALVMNGFVGRTLGATGTPVNPEALRDAREIWVRLKHPGRGPGDGRPVIGFGAATMARAQQALIHHGAAPGRVVPSLGAHTLQFLLERCSARIVLYGFTHQGEKMHSWDAERLWIDQCVATGRVHRASNRGHRVRQPIWKSTQGQMARLINHMKRFRF